MAEPEHPSGTGSRFELLVQSVTDYAIYMLDPQGRVTSWNPGARRFKGYEPEEIIGEHFSRFYTPEEFAFLKHEALGMGFRHVESGPLVRSSYHAHEQAQSTGLA